jgi:CheY-like chemotaxis protein
VKILVADDSRVMRQIVIRTLRQAGYEAHEVVQAEDGRDALGKIKSEQPDLVLCDWHMPEMTGLQILQALRSTGSTVPFGLVTYDVSQELRRQAMEAGALFVIGKPFDEEALRQALAGAVQAAPVPAAQERSGDGAESVGAEVGRDLLPAAKDVREMLAALLARPVTVHAGARVRPTPENPVSLAVYVDQHRSVNVVCLMDLKLSAYIAGALALLPSGGVQEAVEERELSTTLVEALREVVSILAAIVNTPGAPRSKLDKLYPAGTFVPEEFLVMASGFERLDLTVDIPGYGAGSLSLVRTA